MMDLGLQLIKFDFVTRGQEITIAILVTSRYCQVAILVTVAILLP